MARLSRSILLISGAWLVLSCVDSSGPNPDSSRPPTSFAAWLELSLIGQAIRARDARVDRIMATLG